MDSISKSQPPLIKVALSNLSQVTYPSAAPVISKSQAAQHKAWLSNNPSKTPMLTPTTTTSLSLSSSSLNNSSSSLSHKCSSPSPSPSPSHRGKTSSCRMS